MTTRSKLSGFTSKPSPDTTDVVIGQNSTPAGVKYPIYSITPLIDVTAHGVVLDGVTDNTAALQAILNGLTNAGGTLYFPGSLVAGGRSCLITSTLTISKNGVQFVGDGIINSTIVFNPTTNDTLFHFQATDPALPIKWCSIRRMQIRTTNTTHTKTVVDAYDISGFLFQDMYIIGFNDGQGSIAYRIRGRDTSHFVDCYVGAARPLVFSGNPNHTFLDCDIINLHNFGTASVGSTYPAIEFENDVVPYDIVLSGNNVIAGSTSALKANFTGAAPSRPVRMVIDNLRHEQATAGSTYFIDLQFHASTPLAQLIIRGSKCDTNNGIRLAHVVDAHISSHLQVPATKDALNLTGVGFCTVQSCNFGGAVANRNTITLAGDMGLVAGTDLYHYGEDGGTAPIPGNAVYRRVS